jgi:hypothetical protein
MFITQHPGDWFGYTDYINKLYDIVEAKEALLRILESKISHLEKRIKDLEVVNKRKANVEKAREVLKNKRASQP